MELAIAGSIASTAEIMQPRQHGQQAVKIFETTQIPLGEIGFLGCHRSPPANMTVLSCCRKQCANSVPNGRGDIHLLRLQACPSPFPFFGIGLPCERTMSLRS